MPTCKEIHSYTYKNRHFFVVHGKFESEDTEYLQLTEKVTLATNASEFFELNGEPIVNSEPLVLVTRSSHVGEIDISMRYEGMPIEILHEFLSFVEETWRKHV